MTQVPRAEPVGSLLRPDYLRRAREQRQSGAIDDDQLRAIEDRAVREAVALQESVGLDVISDGELRRLTWISTIPLFDDPLNRPPVSGFSFRLPDTPSWMGFWRDEAGRRLPERAKTPRAYVTQPLRVERDLVSSDYAFLKTCAQRRTKYTVPAASYHRVFWHPEHSRAAYPRVEDFLQAIVEYLREQVVKPLIRLGCDYIQLDAPNYGQFYVDAAVRAVLEAEGHDLAAELIADAELDNAVFDGASGITRALHICRGNGPGGIWSASGGYEPVARQAFGRLSNIDRLLLEYDTERAGDFSPLSHVRQDTLVVLGLLTTKRGQLEDRALVEHRIDEATRYVPHERLALSPQCGFNSARQGNPLSAAEQEAKLRLAVDIARHRWKT